jgi:hypothetical protein
VEGASRGKEQWRRSKGDYCPCRQNRQQGRAGWCYQGEIEIRLNDETRASKATAYRLIDKADEKKALVRSKDDELYVVPQ